MLFDIIPMEPRHARYVQAAYANSTWQARKPSAPGSRLSRKAWREHCTLGLCNVFVAVDPEDHDVVFGFSIFNQINLVWVYVRKPFRGFGIARALKACNKKETL